MISKRKPQYLGGKGYQKPLVLGIPTAGTMLSKNAPAKNTSSGFHPISIKFMHDPNLTRGPS